MRIFFMMVFGVCVFHFMPVARLANAAEPPLFPVGDAKVWTLQDASSEMDVNAIFPGNPDVVEKLIPGGKTGSNILTYLIQIDGKNILVDTGLGNPTGPRKSELPDRLAETGVTPDQIDLVVLTHMHGDHIGGLLRNGERAFPRAVVKLGQVEHGYWLDRDNLAKAPDRQSNFDLARAVVDAYEDSLDLFEFGDSIVPGMTTRDAVGHTPGHTALLLESKGEKLLFVGDLIHAAALQFPRPDLNPRYDMDPEAAARTRKKYLELAAEEKLPIAGIHLLNPGIGRVASNGDGSFAFTQAGQE